VKAADRPWLESILEDDHTSCYIIKFEYQWKISENNSIQVYLYVTEKKEHARYYLSKKRRSASIPLEQLQPADHPPLVGDISYGMGRSFVRDNIIIEIYGEGNYRGQWQHIAKQIDSYLLRSQTYDSANEAKPVINQFEIAQNPVAYGTITKLILDVIDPSGGELYYDWMFTPGSLDWGGIETDELGNYYYYAETNESVEELTLLAMNYSGFCATAVLYINVTQNK